MPCDHFQKFWGNSRKCSEGEECQAKVPNGKDSPQVERTARSHKQLSQVYTYHIKDRDVQGTGPILPHPLSTWSNVDNFKVIRKVGWVIFDWPVYVSLFHGRNNRRWKQVSSHLIVWMIYLLFGNQYLRDFEINWIRFE